MASPNERRAAQRRLAKQVKAGENPIAGYGDRARRKAATYISPKTSEFQSASEQVPMDFANHPALANPAMHDQPLVNRTEKNLFKPPKVESALPLIANSVGFGSKLKSNPVGVGLHMPVGLGKQQFGSGSFAERFPTEGLAMPLRGAKSQYEIPQGPTRKLLPPVGSVQAKPQNVRAELPRVKKLKGSMDYSEPVQSASYVPGFRAFHGLGEPSPYVPAGHGETFGVPKQAMHKSGPGNSMRNTPASVMGSTQLGKKRELSIGENLAYGIARHHSMHKGGKKLADHLAAVTQGGLPDKGRISV